MSTDGRRRSPGIQWCNNCGKIMVLPLPGGARTPDIGNCKIGCRISSQPLSMGRFPVSTSPGRVVSIRVCTALAEAAFSHHRTMVQPWARAGTAVALSLWDAVAVMLLLFWRLVPVLAPAAGSSLALAAAYRLSNHSSTPSLHSLDYSTLSIHSLHSLDHTQKQLRDHASNNNTCLRDTRDPRKPGKCKPCCSFSVR